MQLIFLSEDHQNILNNFIVKFSPKAFLQTYEWGNFQKDIGRKIWRIGIFDDNFILQFAATVILYESPLGNYFYCPFGPIFNLDLAENLLISCFKLFLGEIKNLASKENVIFLKIDPLFLKTDERFLNILENFYFRKSFKEIQPKNTLILNLEKSENEIFKKMNPKHRYNIRLAKKRGVEFVGGKISDFEIFFELLVQTATRNHFNLHPKNYYFQMFKNFLLENQEIFNDKLFMKVFFAKFNNKPIATALIAFFSKFAIYLHGGFDYKTRALAPSTLIQWELIKEAKKMGYSFYDFWGIDESSKNWQGITRFKKKFGGKEVNYIGSYDLVFKPIYYHLYRLLSYFKKIIKVIK